MKKRKVRVGIAGYGVVGKRRRNFIDLRPDLETIAVCDINLKNPLNFSENPLKKYFFIKFLPTFKNMKNMKAIIMIEVIIVNLIKVAISKKR